MGSRLLWRGQAGRFHLRTRGGERNCETRAFRNPLTLRHPERPSVRPLCLVPGANVPEAPHFLPARGIVGFAVVCAKPPGLPP
jgi:hypothetical protein